LPPPPSATPSPSTTLFRSAHVRDRREGAHLVERADLARRTARSTACRREVVVLHERDGAERRREERARARDAEGNPRGPVHAMGDRRSTRLNSSQSQISYA